MAIKQLKTTPDRDPLTFINGAGAPKEPAPAPEPSSSASSSAKSTRFFVYMDDETLARIDKECRRRGKIGRSTLLRQLAAEHLPE